MWDVGVDIVEVERFRRMSYSSHEQFYNRIFTSSEIEYCLSSKDSAQRFAATYAGAASKPPLNRQIFLDCNI